MVKSRPQLRQIRSKLVDVTPSDTARTQRATGESVDQRLMARLAEGEITALEELYDRYSTLVFSVGLRILRDHALAEDVTQEVFLRLWRRPQSFDPERGRLLSWLMSITRNRAIDEQRRLSRRLKNEEPSGDEISEISGHNRFEDPALAANIAEERRTVRAALLELPEAQREVIVLAYFHGLTQTEIADRTGAPLGTVKTRVRLAMGKLREYFERSPEQEFPAPRERRPWRLP